MKVSKILGFFASAGLFAYSTWRFFEEAEIEHHSFREFFTLYCSLAAAIFAISAIIAAIARFLLFSGNKLLDTDTHISWLDRFTSANVFILVLVLTGWLLCAVSPNELLNLLAQLAMLTIVPVSSFILIICYGAAIIRSKRRS